MIRLDAALAERGLARSRTHAARLIADGAVSVDGAPVVKASTKVDDDAVLTVAEADHYVSRGAHKLIAALDAFGIDPAGALALDMGASTGGFTQVLLERGADRVLAVDVGHDQLAPLLREDPRVHVAEGFNVRDMTPQTLADVTGVTEAPSLVTGDLSFISLTLVLSAAVGVATSDADYVLLIKPQFEAGRTAVRGGLVSDPAVRAETIETVLWAAWDAGLGTAGLIPSPIAGTHGNREFVVHLSAARGQNPSEYRDSIRTVTGAQ